MKTKTIIMGLLMSILGCKNQEEPKAIIPVVVEEIKKEVTVADIQELVDYIKSRGYEIKVFPPKEETGQWIFAGSTLQQINLNYCNNYLYNINIYENDPTDLIYRKLEEVVYFIKKRDEFIKDLKPNPILNKIKL